MGSTTLEGNPNAVPIVVKKGSDLVLAAQYARRHLGPFKFTGKQIRVLCEVDTPGEAGGPTVLLEAQALGTTTIYTTTDDCAPCAVLPFRAEITVSNP